MSTMCPPSNSDGRFPGFIDREFVTTITPQHYQVSPQCEMSEASFTCSLGGLVGGGFPAKKYLLLNFVGNSSENLDRKLNQKMRN